MSILFSQYNQDLDLQILARLTLLDLRSVSLVNKYTWDFIQSEELWMLRLELEHKIPNLKSFNMTYRKFYINLVGSELAITLVERDRLAELKWLVKLDYTIQAELAILAARHGSLKIIQWMWAEHLFNHANQCVSGEAASNGQVDTVKWLAKNGLPPNEHSINIAVERGYVEIVKWAFSFEKHGINISRPSKATIIGSNNLEMIKMLADRKMIGPLDAINISYKNSQEIIKYLQECGYVIS